MIKDFKLFNSQLLYDADRISAWCEKYNITNYTINEDGSISVAGGVMITNGLPQLPIKFKEVTGFFNCGHSLISLEGCPEEVGSGFYCNTNKLKSLKGCPKIILGSFHCSDNQLTSLKYCPEYVGGDYSCRKNQITNFDGLPEFFERRIDIKDNPVHEIYCLFNESPKCIYYLKEYDVIRGMDVVRDRIEEVFDTLGMDIPEKINLKNYNLV